MAWPQGKGAILHQGCMVGSIIKIQCRLKFFNSFWVPGRRAHGGGGDSPRKAAVSARVARRRGRVRPLLVAAQVRRGRATPRQTNRHHLSQHMTRSKSGVWGEVPAEKSTVDERLETTYRSFK